MANQTLTDLLGFDPTDLSGVTGTLKDLFSGTSAAGDVGKYAGIMGLTALMNKLNGDGTQGIYRGYQGSIPNYTGTRTMNAIPTTYTTPTGQVMPRRPGQGGISYFSPMQYSVANETPAVAKDMLPVAPAPAAAEGGLMGYAAGGGIASLGGYSDGGRLLRGPGDGVSDSIPATIGGRQPAKLADGEFVIPARIVSEIGNGSTEAGARKLYAMMDRVQQARRKTTGKNKVATNTRADKYLPR